MARRKSTNTATTKVATGPAAPEQRTTLRGRLCADPVLRKTKSGKSVSTIRIAVNAPDTDPTFHSVVVWDRTAEVVCEFLRKGRMVDVDGRAQTRTYKAADGTERDVAEVVARRVQFGSAKTDEKAVA